MFKEVLFLDIDQMRAMAPSKDTVVISILDPSENHKRPTFEGFRDVLRLDFEDTEEEKKLAGPGAWPDEPTDEQHAKFSQARGHRVPALSDAVKIVDFLNKHQNTFDQLTLVAHCYGGISRSAAVATWASSRFWAPLIGMRSPDYANPRVIRLLDKAAGRY